VATPWRGREEGGRGRRGKKEREKPAGARGRAHMLHEPPINPSAGREPRATSNKPRSKSRAQRGSMYCQPIHAPAESRGPCPRTVASPGEPRGGMWRPCRMQGSVHPLRSSRTTCRCSMGSGQRRCCAAHRVDRRLGVHVGARAPSRCPRSGWGPARGWELDGRQDARRRPKSMVSMCSEEAAPPVTCPLGARGHDTGKPKGSVATPWRGSERAGGGGETRKREGTAAGARRRAQQPS